MQLKNLRLKQHIHRLLELDCVQKSSIELIICRIWKNAHANEPTSLNPLEYGWMEMENRYVFKWFEGDQLPCFVSDLILNPEESDLQYEDDLSLSEDDSEDEN
ncbi:uncharacterized protein LOC124178627 [Neodiprion fabricii]|uniref:uncharacterized protein LOC124178627 n=1 Tax=Neodiprion fabricii TaxID=2872261 RepID=UPI001ED8C682|nr:uncharacterized protein LOC124178627 [Neodiprion fabricii]